MNCTLGIVPQSGRILLALLDEPGKAGLTDEIPLAGELAQSARDALEALKRLSSGYVPIAVGIIAPAVQNQRTRGVKNSDRAMVAHYLAGFLSAHYPRVALYTPDVARELARRAGRAGADVLNSAVAIRAEIALERLEAAFASEESSESASP